jgi:hypothetical protein
MKKLLILVAAFTISAGVFAQDKMEKKMGHKMNHKMGMKKDCIMMEDGKMMVMKGGSTMAMDKDMKMANGTMVMTDGSVKMKDGKKMMMKDGQCVYMDGKMGMMKMDKPMKHKKVV